MVAYSSCKPCGCNLPAHLLAQHKKGRKHLRNVAAIGIPNPTTPIQLPPPSSLPNSQPSSLLSVSSPTITVQTPITFDSRVTVSHEDGLDFVVQGAEDAGQPSFSPVKHTILIEKTEVLSSLSIPVVRLLPATGTLASWYGLSEDST